MRAELRKIVTVRTPWLLLAAAVALVAVGAGSRIAKHPEDAIGAAAHAGLAALFPLVLGIMAVAGEFRHRTMADTYLSTPDRKQKLLQKLMLYVLIGVGFGIVTATTAAAIVLTQGDELPYATLAGAVAWNALFAAIGVGLGALVRSQVAAIAGALTWLALIEGVAAELLGDSAARWLPFRAAMALGDMPGTTLGQGTAAAVLGAYALAFIGAAFAVRNRDLP